MMFPGEVYAVKNVLALAERYGYGNLISHLRRVWAVRLMKSSPGLTFEQACLATCTDPYPEEWDVDAIARGAPGVKGVSDERGVGDAIDLGMCCACHQVGPTVRNVLLLPKRGPVPGTGWGCFECGLPQDGACAVVCDECMEKAAPLLDVVYGWTADGMRWPYDRLTGEFEHNMALHPEVQARSDNGDSDD